MSGYTVPDKTLIEFEHQVDDIREHRPRAYANMLALVQAVAEDAYEAGRKAAMRGEPAGPVGVAYDATREDET